MVRQIAGSSRPAVVIGAIFLLVGLGWLASATWDLLTHLPPLGVGGPFAWKIDLLGIFLPVAYMIYLMWATRRWTSTVHVKVEQDDTPEAVRALVLFLSPVGRDRELAASLLQVADAKPISDPAVRARFSGPWRMPLEAIAHHRERLQHVIVIPSRDHVKMDRKVDTGTACEVELFAGVVQKLCSSAGGSKPPCVRSLAEAWADSTDSRPPSAGQAQKLDAGHKTYVQGIDFENFQELVDAVEDAYAVLDKMKIPAKRILIDVTGGLKPSSVAGATAALGEGRRFQYVSTRDYHVRTYDIVYL